MKARVATSWALSLVLVGFLPTCGRTQVAPGAAQRLTDPHRHLVDVTEEEEQMPVSTFRMVEVSLDPRLVRENITISQDGLFRAFSTYEPRNVRQDPQAAAFRIFVEDTTHSGTWEIQGLPLPHRPFSDLVWLNAHVLVFDRWSQPHFGIHYAVDMRTKTLLLASPFPDEFFLEQQRPR